MYESPSYIMMREKPYASRLEINRSGKVIKPFGDPLYTKCAPQEIPSHSPRNSSLISAPHLRTPCRTYQSSEWKKSDIKKSPIYSGAEWLFFFCIGLILRWVFPIWIESFENDRFLFYVFLFRISLLSFCILESLIL